MRFERLPLAEALRSVGVACQHCGEPAERLTKGRCHPCYTYYHRTGRDRPAYLLRPTPPPPCSECGQRPATRRGHCHRCYQRRWRYETGRSQPRRPTVVRARARSRLSVVLLPPVADALEAAHTAVVAARLPAPQEAAFERAHQRGPIVCLYVHEVLGLTHATCPICQRLRAEGRSHACTSNPWET